jgi:hypothetical protein
VTQSLGVLKKTNSNQHCYSANQSYLPGQDKSHSPFVVLNSFLHIWAHLKARFLTNSMVYESYKRPLIFNVISLHFNITAKFFVKSFTFFDVIRKPIFPRIQRYIKIMINLKKITFSMENYHSASFAFGSTRGKMA